MNKLSQYTVTRNACTLCNPLGACLVFRGIKNAVPILHGSQGCSTYIRRYLISHFKEPIDIASSNFSENTAIFGGSSNLKLSINNIRSQYKPDFIGISSTCLSETIGDDVPMIIKEYRDKENEKSAIPAIVSVSTPSYKGTHIDGFRNAVKAIVSTLAEGSSNEDHITLLPGMMSPADIRYLKEVAADFELPVIILPDYSETLDGPLWEGYKSIPPGGTSVQDIKRCGKSAHCIELSTDNSESAGDILKESHGVNLYRIPAPIGIELSDEFFSILQKISGKEIPQKYISERGRLVDAYADAHKHAFGIRAILYGEEDLVIPMISFLKECGIQPVLCATASQGSRLKDYVSALNDECEFIPEVIQGADFVKIEEVARECHANMIIGNSKGYTLSRNLAIPLVRIGFPIHDRIGGNRIFHVGYKGTIELFDRIINSHIGWKQERSPVGYTYM